MPQEAIVAQTRLAIFAIQLGCCPEYNHLLLQYNHVWKLLRVISVLSLFKHLIAVSEPTPIAEEFFKETVSHARHIRITKLTLVSQTQHKLLLVIADCAGVPRGTKRETMLATKRRPEAKTGGFRDEIVTAGENAATLFRVGFQSSRRIIILEA
ncbi:hypothetical protein KSF_058770 [Reticulibacter mediterranei]|uniref:Uncharacterized protein n=1 Tax=Reticulibacter mediterranei TaxID=2778369 RepID=A0A8J3N254_9CHLR|nr:hypothetical protein [Reticulibacter mediterranei]GHO95829.1 hypothetical protein KSF_058770 [Reticulibacter mediterranei]